MRGKSASKKAFYSPLIRTARQVGGGSALPKACCPPAKVLHHEVNNLSFSATFISTIEGALLVIERLLHLAVDLEQTIIFHHGVRLSTSKPAHGRCRSPSAARFGSRSQLAPRRVFCGGLDVHG